MANTVPISLSTLQENINVQSRTDTPADVVAAAGRAMADAYKAYHELKVLAGPLNGLTDSALIPESIKFDEIVVHFRVNNEPKVVKLHSVQRVGDLYRLLTLEIDRLVGIMRAQAALAQTNAAAIETACNRSQYVVGAQQGRGPE